MKKKTPRPKTIRLNFPQWQGGAVPLYHLGSQLLRFLAPSGPIPEFTIDVPPPEEMPLEVENGIHARATLLRQTDQALEILRQHEPGRVVIFGGDFLVDLAPFAYLSERYGDDLAILWLDAHPDVMTAAETKNAHAMVVGLLLGAGDDDFVKRVLRPIKPEKLIYAGLYDMSPIERQRYYDWGLKMATPNDLLDSSDKILSWLDQVGAKHVAIHFDLDVINPAELRSLWFSRPHARPHDFRGIPQGRMGMEQVVRLIHDVARHTDIVGLGITEFLPWDRAIMRDLLCQLPILRDDANT